MALTAKQCAQCTASFSGDTRYTFQRYCSVKCRKRCEYLRRPPTVAQKAVKAETQRKFQATSRGKEKMREYSRRWYQKNADKVRARDNEKRVRSVAIFHAMKSKSGCIDCGFNDHPAALQFDHVRGKKVGAVSDFNSASPRALAEAKKCEVRCANCHAIRHYEDKRGYGSLASSELLGK